jgi:putative transposase
VDYVLGYFGRTTKGGRKAYIDYVGVGMTQGRREDLAGGGLVRSAGGWSEVKALRRQGQDQWKGGRPLLTRTDTVSSINYLNFLPGSPNPHEQTQRRRT